MERPTRNVVIKKCLIFIFSFLFLITSIVIAQFQQQSGGGGPLPPPPPVVGGNVPVNTGQNIGPQGSQLFSGIGDNLLYGGYFNLKK